MKKILSFALMLLVSISAFAFDFTGKTFKGSISESGKRLSMSFAFKNNHRCTFTGTATGEKPAIYNMYWEVSGDFINVCNVGGSDYLYLAIEQEDGQIVLEMTDPDGNYFMTLYQVAASSSAGKAGATRKKKR